MATAIKENTKYFYKYINNQRSTKENLHPLLDREVNIVTKDEERLGYFMRSLPQSLIVRPVVLQVLSPLR